MQYFLQRSTGEGELMGVREQVRFAHNKTFNRYFFFTGKIDQKFKTFANIKFMQIWQESDDS